MKLFEHRRDGYHRAVDFAIPWRPSAVCLALVLASAGPSAGQDEQGEAPAFERPAYGTLRFTEDWSGLAGLDRKETGDIFDPIKYLPVWDEPRVWLSLGGQARLRYESWNRFNFGLPAGRDDADIYLQSRFRYHADLHATEYVRGFVEGKSAFSTPRDLLGGRRGLDVDELDLQNGFVDIKLPLAEAGTLTLRSGRQELLFGKQRLVSPLDWSNTRRTFEGFSGIFDAGDYSLTGFYTQFVPVRKYDFNKADAGTEFFGFYGKATVPEILPRLKLEGDLYFLGLLKDAAAFNGTAGEEDRYTFGGRADGRLPDMNVDFELEGAYQFGDLGAGDIDAFMIATEGGYTFEQCACLPRFHIGLDYASGDDDPGGDVNTFNQLFPLGHAYLGFIDAIGRQNIIDIREGLTVKPTKKFTIRLDGHYFMRADTEDRLYNAGGGPVPGTSTGGSRYVGAEVDLLLKYAFDRHLVGMAGYSHFFSDEFIEEFGGDDVDFVYLIAQYTF